MSKFTKISNKKIYKKNSHLNISLGDCTEVKSLLNQTTAEKERKIY